MTPLATLKAACLLAVTLALTSALAATKNEVDQAMSRDGLQKISVKGLDLAYARPGASLAAYKRVRIEPVDVEFDKSWDPAKTGSRIKLSNDEREKIKAAVARLVEEEFAKAVQKGGSYQIASDAAPDVLRVKVSILNLYVNAPSAGPGATAGRSRTYVSSAGKMTLLAELSDSTSGQMLARVADVREANASGAGRMELADRMMNEDAARNVAASWAQILRKALDKARSIGS
ncbi:MAG TPA: DUF3313 family protein [Caldimonas sp.]|nr:DUF3313 family protein [Caldimonas sp.]